jgi:hypothetical protein
MTTDDATDTGIAEPVTDTTTARVTAEYEAMQERKAMEDSIAAEQDAALAAVKAECDAYRAALAAPEVRPAG